MSYLVEVVDVVTVVVIVDEGEVGDSVVVVAGGNPNGVKAGQHTSGQRRVLPQTEFRK